MAVLQSSASSLGGRVHPVDSVEGVGAWSVVASLSGRTDYWAVPFDWNVSSPAAGKSRSITRVSKDEDAARRRHDYASTILDAVLTGAGIRKGTPRTAERRMREVLRRTGLLNSRGEG
jgi:hypothetical protein